MLDSNKGKERKKKNTELYDMWNMYNKYVNDWRE